MERGVWCRDKEPGDQDTGRNLMSWILHVLQTFNGLQFRWSVNLVWSTIVVYVKKKRVEILEILLQKHFNPVSGKTTVRQQRGRKEVYLKQIPALIYRLYFKSRRLLSYFHLGLCLIREKQHLRFLWGSQRQFKNLWSLSVSHFTYLR